MSRPNHRPDIEGLRGLAILLVVLFHAGVSTFRGGFVGVDVFFVLSGFFITAMLASELAETGDVDVNAFYTRRALRLLPALLVTLIVTLGAVFWLYAPIDRADIAGDARAVSLYAGNINFAQGAVDYFGARDNPLLHTWSLAVEEQFYLAWPLLFLSLAMFGLASRGRKALFAAIAMAGVASFLASLWLTSASQPWAFFGLPTRIWEFALGGSLALAIDGRSDTRSPMSPVLQWAGLAMIAFAATTYDRVTPYPGFAALLPALGACFLLLGGNHQETSLVNRLLGVPWLTWLGRMSYAWYLWHWPMVGVAAVLFPGIGVWGRLGWSAAALVLAWMTHRFIEAPVRNGSTALKTVPSHWLLPGAVAASAVVAVAAHALMKVAEQRVSTAPQKQFALARNDRKNHGCWANTVDDVKQLCEFGDKASSTTVVLFGDSHAEHWLGALDKYGREHGIKIVAMVKGGCPVADMPELVQPRLKRFYYECTRYREAMVQQIIAMKPHAAILSSYDHYVDASGRGNDWQVKPETWRDGLRRTYGRLSQAGVPVVAVRGTPRTGFDVPACLSRQAAGLFRARECVFDRARSFVPVAIDAQTEAARGLGVAFVDMNDQVCSAARGHCPVMRDGIVIFTDDNHLTATFSQSVSEVFGGRVEAAIRNLGKGD